MANKLPFEAIVEMHGPTVLRVCRAVVGAAEADDAWSETFLSAMKAYPSLPDDANVEAWLVTIAHRRAIDVGRARSRRAVPTDSSPTTPTDPVASNRRRPHGGAAKRCPTSNASRWPTTTWAAFPTPRSPRSWAGPPKRRDAPPPTGSPRSDAPTVGATSHAPTERSTR